jgi:FdhD protein
VSSKGPTPDPRSLARIERDGVEDFVAVEDPLEIRVDGEPLAVTMRTPGHDEELALGFLHGEGLIDSPLEAGLTDDLAGNVVEVAGPLIRDPGVRSFYTTSSCGVCGKGAIEQVEVLSAPLPPGPEIERDTLASLPERLRQPGFDRTGGLHATGLFDPWGEAVCVREDVGRHNAMDKVIGWALREGLVPLRDSALCVSGRLSFELVQKAAVAGAPILVGVGAPSSLAIELAKARGMTLAGFARHGSVNVYSGSERVRE